MAFYVAFFPVQKASGVVPLVAGAVWAIDVAAPVAIRYLASEIAISSVVKAVQVSNAYYSATSTLSNSKYLKYFKSKAALGVAAFVTVLDALGLYLSDDNFYSSDESTDEPGAAEAGYFWSSPDGRSSSASGIADIRIASLVSSNPDNTYSYEISSQNEKGTSIRYTFYRVDTDEDGNSKNIYVSARTAGKYPCSKLTSDESDLIFSCQDGFVPNSGAKVDDTQVETQLLGYLSNLGSSDQLIYFGNSEGVIDSDLKDDFESDNVPLMPDGSTPIPNIGAPSWNNAHLIATGVAQSSDSSSPDYVSSDDWDEAYYLANTVANGNDYITGLNSGVITVPDTETTPDTGSNTDIETGDVTVTVDVSGVENRLDTTNQLSQSILDELSLLNNASVSLQVAPEESSAASFWPLKYPDGLLGVLNKFIEDMKKTPIFEWLSEFVIDLGSGSIPAFDLCFNVIAGIDFGCYTLQADSYIWSAIKACMILFSVIVSRRIVFGG